VGSGGILPPLRNLEERSGEAAGPAEVAVPSGGRWRRPVGSGRSGGGDDDGYSGGGGSMSGQVSL
jgi:hypothetical protein